jgi:hypothetical protein
MKIQTQKEVASEKRCFGISEMTIRKNEKRKPQASLDYYYKTTKEGNTRTSANNLLPPTSCLVRVQNRPPPVHYHHHHNRQVRHLTQTTPLPSRYCNLANDIIAHLIVM